MKSQALRTTLLAAALAVLAGCAVQERESRIDVTDLMKADMRACGTDIACLRKREAARSKGTTPATGAKTGAP